MKIKQIIVILFIILSVIPMTLLGMANLYFYNNRLEKVLENDLRNTVSTQMKAINNFLTERRAEAKSIVRNPLVHYLLRGEVSSIAPGTNCISLVNEALALCVEYNPYVESVTILGTDFTVVSCSDASAVGETSTLKDIDKKYLTSELLFTPVIETKRDGSRARVIAAVEEIYYAGRLEGYLVLELNLEFFEEIRDSAKVYNNGTIYIIDGNNGMITAGDTVSSRDNFVLSIEERSDYHRAWEERDRNSDSGILRYKARGDRYFSYYAQFQDIDWTIISSVNIDQVLEIKRGYLELAIQIALVLVCLLAAVSYIVRRYLDGPIQNMIHKFETIEQTEEYSVRMDQSGCYEINAISDSVNTLLAGMEKYMKKERRIQEALKVKAERDPLTGLYNKEAFGRRLERELERAKRGGTELACIFLDVDNFKDFNTLYGHTGGDKVLVFIAEALRSQVGGLACRQGGDEFSVCIPGGLDRKLIRSMADDLIETLHHGLRLEEKGGLVPVSCSIGIVFSDESISTASDLIQCSDKAMYEVKNSAKDGYRIWEEQG